MLTLSQYVSPFLLISSLVSVRDKWPESAFIRQHNGVTNMLAVYLFVIGYSASWGPVPWVLVSEIFPTRLRAYGVGLAGMRPSHILSLTPHTDISPQPPPNGFSISSSPRSHPQPSTASAGRRS